MVKRIDFEEAKYMLDHEPGCVLLDVRTEEEYITGHPMEAELLTLDEIDADTAKERIPHSDTPVIVYCRSGRRSREAAELLERLGYTRLYDVGSMIGWPYGSF